MAKKTQITIDQNDSGWTETDLSSAVLGVFAEYTVPAGMALEFKPSDIIALYLEDNATTAAELNGSIPVQVVIEEPFSIGTKLLAKGEYARFKTYDDITKTFKIGQRMAAPSNSVVKLKANPNAGIASLDASDCRFTLTCSLISPN